MKFKLKEQTCTFHFLAKGSEWYIHDSFLCVKYSKVCLVRILVLIFFFLISIGIFFLSFFSSYFDVITFQSQLQNSYHLCPKQKYSICLQNQTKKYCKIKGKKLFSFSWGCMKTTKFFFCCCKLLPDTVVEKVS